MSILKIRTFCIVFFLTFGLMSSPAQAHWSEFIFKIFGKGSAVVEGKVIANEGKVIAQEVKVIDDSAGAFDDVINWFKRLFGIPVDTKLENELARRFGDYAKKKVRNETKECTLKVYKANQQNQESQFKRAEEQSRDLCAGAVLKCLNTNYRQVKNPTTQMFDRCIKEVNSNISKYIKLK